MLSIWTVSLFLSVALLSQKSMAQGTSSLVAPRKVALGIYVIDRYAILSQEIDAQKELYEKIFPEIEFVAVSADVGTLRFDVNRDYNRSAVIQTLIDQIKTKILPTDVITQLFFSDHGSYNYRGSGLSSLEHLGYFSATEISYDLQRILNPIQKQFAANALLFFESCSLVSQNPKEAINSTQNLVRNLEIPNARVWASVTPYVADINLATEYSTGKSYFLSLEDKRAINTGYDIHFSRFRATQIQLSNGRSNRILLIRESGSLPPRSSKKSVYRCEKFFQ